MLHARVLLLQNTGDNAYSLQVDLFVSPNNMMSPYDSAYSAYRTIIGYLWILRSCHDNATAWFISAIHNKLNEQIK